MAGQRGERHESDIVKVYLRSIGQYALLTKHEETRLAKMIEAGREAVGGRRVGSRAHGREET